MISFIIPVLNEEKIIEKTLKWISEYDGEKEIILSDGRSTDKTIEIAKKYTDKIVVYSGTVRQTISDARNLGASVAKGDYLAFVDADVSIKNPNEFFKTALNYFKENDKMVAVTGYIKVLPEYETKVDKIIFTCFNYMWIFVSNVLHIGAAFGEFQLIKTDVFRKLKGYDKKHIGGEDHEMFRRLARAGKTFYSRELMVYHTGRRAHKIGWPRLLFNWGLAAFPPCLQKIFLGEWKVVR